MAEMVSSDKIAPDVILNSKLIAYETEIQSLTADKLLLEQDFVEIKEKFEKINNELKVNMQTIDSMKSENSVLKKNLKKTHTELQNLKETSSSLIQLST